MPRTPFINLDAEYLATLGDTFLDDDDLETGMRLLTIARHLESLDGKYMALVKGDAFDAGVMEGLSRAYERSNLPPAERSISAKMREAVVRTTVQPTRVSKPAAAPKKPSKYANLNIKLEL